MRDPTVTRTEARNRPGLVGLPCPRCRAPIMKPERIVVTETQTSWFRGEDDVAFRHEKCPTSPHEEKP